MKNKTKNSTAPNFKSTVLANVICYLWTHEVTFNDNGYDVCDRCGKHEHYDSDSFHDGKPFLKLSHFVKSKINDFNWWYRRNIRQELPF